MDVEIIINNKEMDDQWINQLDLCLIADNRLDVYIKINDLHSSSSTLLYAQQILFSVFF